SLCLLLRRAARGLSPPADHSGTDRLHRNALDGLDLAQKILELGVRLALDGHAADIADIALVVTAGIDRHDLALLPFLVRGRAVHAGAAGNQTIFEGEPAVCFFAAQRLDHFGLGDAGLARSDHS